MSHSRPKALVDAIRSEIQASIALKQLLIPNEGLMRQVSDLTQQCIGALCSGEEIIFAGHVGSFADAQNLSAEFTARFMMDRAPLDSLALGANNSALSAIGDDYGCEHVFVRELQGIASQLASSFQLPPVATV